MSPSDREDRSPSSSRSRSTPVPTPGAPNRASLARSSPSWSTASATPQSPRQSDSQSYFPSSSNPRQALSRTLSSSRRISVNTDMDDNFDEEDEERSATEVPLRSSTDMNPDLDEEEDEEADGQSDERRARQYTEDDPLTLKDRQSLMNVDHPFGLPIWKPALYKKSRTVNRDAETALHAIPTSRGGRHITPGNIAWTALFGIWMSAICLFVSAVLFVTPFGGRRYAPLIYGLGWYLFWPFGKYVEGFSEEDSDTPDVQPNRASQNDSEAAYEHGDTPNVHFVGAPTSERPSSSASGRGNHSAEAGERTAFFKNGDQVSYGTVPSTSRKNSAKLLGNDWVGRAMFWMLLVFIIAPVMLTVCLICWFLVFTVPMAKLNWTLVKFLFHRPDYIRFCMTPPSVVVSSASPSSAGVSGVTGAEASEAPPESTFTIKATRLSAGQAAPSGAPSSTVLLCTYRAMGFQYYKYTIGGVNIFFVNLMAVVIFAIVDGFVLLPMKERMEEHGDRVPIILDFLASQALVFSVGLVSVIPLSYFIGMAVASISAQSSIGMGAVINASFGSIIEIILYAMMLTQGKGRLVEGSIIGSLLAGVLLMPGASMCSSAIRRKEQRFNAKSAGVTSTMLIMAIIGTLTPTLFYQTYGNFQLICDGCPSLNVEKKAPWACSHCYYEHPNPVHDEFYQSTVKSLMYFCAVILLLSYVIGLWFSLRTHASQIWQNPQQLMHPLDIPTPGPGRMSFYHRLTNTGLTLPTHRISRKTSNVTNFGNRSQSRSSSAERDQSYSRQHVQAPSPILKRRHSEMPPAASYSPLVESVQHGVKATGMQSLQLPDQLTQDDFTRAVAVATVSALRHQQAFSHSPGKGRAHPGPEGHEDAGGHGGHEAPSWSRATSATVLLACTALYAAIAEVLVDVVDVVLQGSGIDEKFLGLTLFALVPNTTEFMNAVSFAMYGNIALSMEIGSAYALQVCLLQIPAMVAFSAWYDPQKMGTVADTFTLIFPRWDVIAIILSIFLLTYTYIEAKSNYHRGSILILSYIVLVAGFYFAPQRSEEIDLGNTVVLSAEDGTAISVAESFWIFFTSFLAH